MVISLCTGWWAGASDDRQRLVRHALRTLVKAANPVALEVIGYGASSPIAVRSTRITPPEAAIGTKIQLELDLHNPSIERTGALVDLRVHFVKADGTTRPKVFKGAEVDLGPDESKTIRKTISVAQQSTRTHHPGIHPVDAIVNGSTVELGSFELTAD